MESSVTHAEPELVADDLPPDEDDFDIVDVPDVSVGEFDTAPADEGPNDEVVADTEPVMPAEVDAPYNAEFPEDDPDFDVSILGADFDGYIVPAEDSHAPEDPVVRRWRHRLRIRQQLLADAKEELAHAHTPAEVSAAKAKVAKRKSQVEYAKHVLERRKTTVAERLVRAASLAYHHAALVHYTMDRPFRLAHQGGHPRRWDGIRLGLRAKHGQFPRYADCSSFVTWCYWDALGGPHAGADIVNGQHWQAGFTGSQLDHGREVPASQARAGDLAFYQRGSSIGHVTIVVAPGVVISHGSEAGPLRLALNFDGMLRHVRRYID
jgi:cell wall-associated NlpC family hydrolase